MPYWNDCWGETMTEARKKYEAKADEEARLALADVKRRRAKILEISDDGEDGVTVEFTRDNGERVIADYAHVGWRQPPAEVGEAADRALNTPPLAVHQKSRGVIGPPLPPEKTPSS